MILKEEGCKTWEEMLDKNNIEYISHFNMIPNNNECIYTTRCSQKKSDRDKGKSKDIYISNLNKNFYNKMERYNLEYATISDKYGLIFSNEIISNYDLSPSNLDEKDKKRLGENIRKKVLKENYNSILFYNTSPLMSKPYFEILVSTKLQIYFLKTLKFFDAKFGSYHLLESGFY